MRDKILPVSNSKLDYCKGCAKHTAEVIEETESRVTLLCGICGRIYTRRGKDGKD